MVNTSMKAKEFLKESVTFSVSQYTDQDGTKMYNTLEDQEEKECWVCNGTGVDPYYPPHTCDYCKGKKTYKAWIPRFGELDVSQLNAEAFLNALGYDTQELIGGVH